MSLAAFAKAGAAGGWEGAVGVWVACAAQGGAARGEEVRGEGDGKVAVPGSAGWERRRSQALSRPACLQIGLCVVSSNQINAAGIVKLQEDESREEELREGERQRRQVAERQPCSQQSSPLALLASSQHDLGHGSLCWPPLALPEAASRQSCIHAAAFVKTSPSTFLHADCMSAMSGAAASSAQGATKRSSKSERPRPRAPEPLRRAIGELCNAQGRSASQCQNHASGEA